ncbi:MAG: MBL fold metallo-hydrolase RNA specificity domain-containing protein [Candidatus Aenigmarchaeota archaeon]|nr:MBL fold metallo-hydrolase RNA specificity domain-containing protein [Candidatus Aenigmarchaeota archaeon]
MRLKLTRIKKIEKIPFKGYLYDITTPPHHNFLANNILVHNCEGTMGRRIQKGWKEIPFKVEEGKTITLPLKMEIQTLEGLSGHSDKNQLLAYIGRLSARPERIVVVHGENQKATEFSRSAQRIFRIDTIVPRNLEAIRLK